MMNPFCFFAVFIFESIGSDLSMAAQNIDFVDQVIYKPTALKPLLTTFGDFKLQL
jgi:hypothetical protein